jgi:hypothetical protein
MAAVATVVIARGGDIEDRLVDADRRSFSALVYLFIEIRSAFVRSSRAA